MFIIPKLIMVTGSSCKSTKIAVEHGWLYGAQLPSSIFSKLYFADQNWKIPRRVDYISHISLYRPTMATVLDLERESQYNEVIDWAEEISQYVEYILIIPKVNGIIKKIPKSINGKTVVLAFSVPTEYAGTYVDINEFHDWPIHLLGGSPFEQLRFIALFKNIAEVISIDGNYANKQATKRCQFFSIKRTNARNKHWPTIEEFDGRRWEGDISPNLEAFRRSCITIKEFWQTQWV